ncbi:MAG: LacI family DNA-binding transcriptional regulator [Rikenellaceae bacterium]
MASIKDIAQELGISSTTVSLVLTGKYHNGRISKAMVDKVLHTANKMNYHPNIIAKSLKSGSTKSVGLIVADITNPYFAQLVFVIQNYLLKFGYTTIIMNTNENVNQMENTITMLHDRRVDGFIIVPTFGGDRHIKNLIRQGYSLVLMDRFYPEIESCSVMSDNYLAIHNSVDRLVESNASGRIYYVSITNNMVQVSERLRGYREAMENRGLLREEDIYLVDYDSPQNQLELAIDNILTSATNNDTIIFAINRLSTIGAKILMSRGIEIGRDIKVVYFDKTNTFDLLPYPTPHITQPIEQIGTLSAKLLLQQLNKEESFKAQTHLLPCSLHNF